MGLSQDVSNTQTGAIVKSVNQPAAGSIKSAGVSKPAEKMKAEAEAATPAAAQPDVKDSSWQGLYNFISTSDEFGTDLSYDQFVNKYANDERNLRRLFSTITINSTTGTPFQSSNWNDFKANEYNNYFGHKVAAEKPAQQEEIIPQSTAGVVSDAANIGKAVAGADESMLVPNPALSEPSVLGSLTDLGAQADGLPIPEPISVSGSNLGGGAAGQVDSSDWNQAPKGVYKAGLGDTSPVSREESSPVVKKKPVGYKSIDEILSGIGSEENAEDKRSLVLDINTGKPFGSLIAQEELTAIQRKKAEVVGSPSLSEAIEKKTTDFFNSAAAVNAQINTNAEENFKKKIAIQSNITVEKVDENKEKWAYDHKLKFPDGEDGLSLEERQIRDKYANSYAVKEANDTKSEYFTDMKRELGDKAPEYWIKKRNEISMDYLSQEDLQIASLKQKITSLEKLEKRTLEQEVELKKYKQGLSVLKDLQITGEDLFDKEGKFISNKAVTVQDQGKFVNAVNKYAEIYENTDKGTLTKELDNAFFQYVNAKRSYDSAVKYYDMIKYGSPDVHVNAARDEISKTQSYMDDRLAYFMGVNRALVLNEDPGTGEDDGFTTGFSEGIKSGLGFESFSKSALKDRAIEGIQNIGFELTDDQVDKVGSGFWESAGRAAGESFPMMVEIGVNLWVANKAAGILQVPKLAQLWAGANKTKQFYANVAWDMVSQGYAFSASGESAFAGVGEGVGQAIGTKMLGKLGVTNIFANFAVRLGAGAITESLAEYTGQFTEEMFKEGSDVQKACEATFGKTASEGVEKLVITLLVAGFYGVPGAAMGSSTNGDEGSFLFCTKAMEEIRNSDSKSPIVKYAKENDFTVPATEKEISEKDEILAKKEAGEDITEEEIAKAELVEEKIIFQESKEGAKYDPVISTETASSFDFSDGITAEAKKEEAVAPAVEEKKQSKAEQKGTKVVGNAIVETPTTVVKATEKKAPSRKTATKTTVKSEKVEAKPAPVVEVKAPEMKVSKPEGFTTALKNLGYSDSDISSMTIEQQQDIAIKKTEKPIVENTTKVDSVKENIKQEKIAEAQKKIDEQIAEDAKVEVKEEPVKESRKIPNRKTTTRKTATKVDVVKEAPKVETKKEENVAKEKPVTKTPEPVVEPVVTEGTTRTEDTGRKEQPATEVESGKSGNKKVRPVIGERKLSTTVKKEPVVEKKQKQLTREQNQSVQSLNKEQVSKLREKLGTKTKTSDGKQVQKDFAASGGDVNDFIAAVEEIERESVQTYAQTRAEFDSVFNEAEKARKEGKSEKAVELYNKAKEIMPDQSERIDVAIDVAKSEVVDAKSIKLKEEVAAEEAAVAEEESVKSLDDVRSKLIDSEVTATASNKSGDKRSVSGKVLSVNRKSKSGGYEVLIDNGDGKSATKAKYNPDTKEFTIIPQEKGEEISNKSNFENSKERKEKSSPEKKKEKQQDVIDRLTAKLITDSDSAGSEIALDLDKDGEVKGIKRAFKSLLKKIAYGLSERVTPQYIADLKSELNGLIKDSESIQDIKIRSKLRNMIDSISEKDSETNINEEAEALAVAEKVEVVAPVKKEKSTEKKPAKKSKQTGKQEYDSVISSLDEVKSFTGKRVINFPKEMKPIYDSIKALHESGKITDQEYAALMDEYRTISLSATAGNNKIKAEDQKAVKAALNSNKPTSDDSMIDDNYQYAETHGQTQGQTRGRIAPAFVKIEDQRNFLKKAWDKFRGKMKNKTISDIKRDLIEKTRTIVFEQELKLTKKVDEKRVKVTPRWIGVFKKSANYIVLKGKNDLNTLIHEVGHAISYRFKLNDAISSGAYDTELAKLWDFGSRPPATKKVTVGGVVKSVKTNANDKLQYKREEGIAEFIRAYSVNPEIAKANFPALTALYESKVSADVKKAVAEFGFDFAVLDSLPQEELMELLYNNQAYVEQYLQRDKWHNRVITKTNGILNGIRDVLRGKGESRVNDNKGRISMGWWTYLHTSVAEKTGALGATVKFMKKRGVEFLAGNNPYTLIRNMSNFSQNRFKNLTSMGLVDKFGNRVITKSGNLMNFKWLFEEMGGGVSKISDYVSSYLIAKGVVYEIDSKGNIDIITNKLGGKFTDEVVRKQIEVIEDIKKSNPDLHKVIIESASRWQEMALQTVKYRYDKGLITEKRYKEISEGQDNYVALFRDLEERNTDVIRKKQSTQRKAQEVHKREGSEEKIENPYASLLELIMESYYEGDRNHAISSFVGGLKQLGDKTGGTEIFTEQHDGLKPISYFENGEFKTVFVSEDIAYVIDAMNSPSVTGNPVVDFIVELISTITNKLPKAFLTSTPGFLNRNIIRDTFTRPFVSRYKRDAADIKTALSETASLPKEFLQHVRTSIKISQLKTKQRSVGLTSDEKAKLFKLEKNVADSDASILELYGGTMSGWYHRSAKKYYAVLKELQDEFKHDGRSVLFKFGSKVTPGSIRRGWLGMLSSAENVNRIAEFKKVFAIEYKKNYEQFIKEGMNETDAKLHATHHARTAAAFEAKDLMDFTVAGSNMGVLNKLFMFNNPSIQGWNRSAKTFTGAEKGGKKAALSRILGRWVIWSAIATTAEAAWSAANDDDDELYNQPGYMKDTFWSFKIADNSWFRVPKPFEYGMLSSIMSRAYASANGNEYAWSGFGESLEGMLPPFFKPGMLLDNPIAQLYTGRDEFRGKDIIPSYEKNLDVNLRNTKYSSSFSKDFSEFIGVDPRYVDQFTSKAFSDWGNMFLNAYETINDEDGDYFEPLEVLKKKHTGLITESPTKNSATFQKLDQIMGEKGMKSNNKEFDELNNIYKHYKESDTDAQKDLYAEKYRIEANRLIDRFEAIIARDGNLNSIGGAATEEQKEQEKKAEASSSNSRGSNRGGGNRGGGDRSRSR